MKYKEIIIHIICWLAFFLLISYWQSNLFTLNDALLHSVRIISLGALIFYINLYVLLPVFFSKNQYVRYAVSTILLLVGTSYLFEFTSELLPKPDFNFRVRGENPRNMYFTPPGNDNLPSGRVIDNQFPKRIIIYGLPGRVFVFTMLNSIPVLFLSTIIWITNENRKRRQREITLKNESLQSEMRFLKSQINPHFLFNALNNIYSLSFIRSEKTPQMIMKLSDMLRHVVYDSSNLVAVEKEISYINNFIDFQKLKIGTRVNVSFDYQGVNKNLKIEPMLLTPFVENAFKHSDIESNPRGYISIELSTKGKKLSFEVKNTFSIPDHEETKDETPGIGIQNVKKRLQLAYPDQAKLMKEVTGEVFSIKLELTSG